MKKLFISQPMNGIPDEEVLRIREEIKSRAEKQIGEPLELINSFIEESPKLINKHVSVWYLGKSIIFMAQADVVYFGGDWRNARGCKIEHEIAKQYGVHMIEE